MKLGLIGLGKMGSAIALKLLQDGHEVVVWNRSSVVAEELKLKAQSSKRKAITQNLKLSESVQHLVSQLAKPRIIWLMLPAGEATQSLLDEVIKFVEPDDIVIDGGNAYFKDTERRSKEISAKGIGFLGIGVSGGIHGFANGYALMAGGDASGYTVITPILDSLAKPNGGCEYFGEGGAGHFVKMIHNGIEYGMMQAIGEGFGVFEKAPYTFDLQKIASLWQKGTIISGFLIDRTVNALEKPSILDSIEGKIDSTGEAQWTVEQAKKEGVPIENIEQALHFRKRSKIEPVVRDSFAAKLIASLRQEFGGHPLHKKN